MTLRPLLRSATRCYPLASGCGTIANSSLFRRIAPGSPEIRTTRLRSGPQIDVRLDDYVGRSIYYFGDLDPKITFLCRRLLRRGDVVLDVGANWGLVSLVAAALVGSTGIVHAFEPQPNLAESLRRSAERNGFAYMHVHLCALSNSDGNLDLIISAENSGSASLGRGEPGLSDSPGTRINVEVRETTRAFAALDLPPVRLLKIDVEGHEGEVLQGGTEFLRQTPPAAVLLESNDRTLPFWSRAAIQHLDALEYGLIAVGKGLLGPRLVVLDRGAEPPADANDFLAIHPQDRESIGGSLRLPMPGRRVGALVP